MKKGMGKRSRTLSFKRLLVSFIVVAGFYPIAILNYYVSGKVGHGAPPPEWVAPLPENGCSGGGGINNTVVGESKRTNASATTINRRKNTDVIVYLAQFGHHSSYGAQLDARQNAITGLSKLNRSLELLYSNYASRFPTDVIIFYDKVNAPNNYTMAELRRHDRPRLHFRMLDDEWWTLPYGLQAWQHYLWNRPAFSIRYRLMMRWYAILIWPYLHAEGYTHVMRLDDDSYILSEINYNLFDYMRDSGKKYGFVQPVFEPGGDQFNKLVDRYLENHPDETSRELIDLYKQDRGVGFYNNFFMADVSFFASPPASRLLKVIDESKLIFTQRTGDLVIQSAVARLFLSPDEVHWFRDFTYEHMTLCGKEKCGYQIHRGCPQNGGVSRGMGYTDAEWRRFALEEVRNRFAINPQKCFVPINQHFVGAEDVRTCSRLHSRCGFYLKLVSGVNGTVDNPNWLQRLYDDGEIALNRTEMRALNETA